MSFDLNQGDCCSAKLSTAPVFRDCGISSLNSIPALSPTESRAAGNLPVVEFMRSDGSLIPMNGPAIASTRDMLARAGSSGYSEDYQPASDCAPCQTYRGVFRGGHGGLGGLAGRGLFGGFGRFGGFGGGLLRGLLSRILGGRMARGFRPPCPGPDDGPEPGPEPGPNPRPEPRPNPEPPPRPQPEPPVPRSGIASPEDALSSGQPARGELTGEQIRQVLADRQKALSRRGGLTPGKGSILPPAPDGSILPEVKKPGQN